MFVAELCKGSTSDSDSLCLGSNPSSAAKKRLSLASAFFCKLSRFAAVSARCAKPAVYTDFDNDI